MLKELKDLFFRLLKSSLKKGKMTSKPFSKWPNDRERKNANCKISDAEKGNVRNSLRFFEMVPLLSQTKAASKCCEILNLLAQFL